jgi:NitT/TauT family transport system permease protein
LAIAQLASINEYLASDNLAAPSDIAIACWQAMVDGTLFKRTIETLAAALGGLLLGGSLGLLLGILLGLFRAIDQMMTLSIEAVRPIPPSAVIPVFLLIFGFGFPMEISIVAFSTIWTVLILTRAAVAGIEPRLLEVSRALGLNFAARVWKIILPAALPRIFVAFRLAFGISLIVAVTVEVVANPLGLGYNIMLAQQTLRPDLMFALLLWIGLTGWTLNAVLLWAQRRLFGPAAIIAATT